MSQAYATISEAAAATHPEQCDCCLPDWARTLHPLPRLAEPVHRLFQEMLGPGELEREHGQSHRDDEQPRPRERDQDDPEEHDQEAADRRRDADQMVPFLVPRAALLQALDEAVPGSGFHARRLVADYGQTRTQSV